MSSSSELPLSGLVVVDLCQFLSGPYASLRLQDLGARVIKIERPEGDFARMVFWQELGASVWAWCLLASTQWLGWRPLLIALAQDAPNQLQVVESVISALGRIGDVSAQPFLIATLQQGARALRLPC